MSEFRDYENGVADVLTFLADGAATVERNVRLRGVRSGRSRQIDVLVRGRIFGAADMTLIVDCKRRKSPVDVKKVEEFIGMVEDVGSELGMIVTSSGSSGSARTRATSERGIRLQMLTLEELVQWSPPGTLTITYGVSAARVAQAKKALREAGFRVTADRGFEPQEGESIICALRHTGQRTPSAEIQAELLGAAQDALADAGIELRHVAHGVVMSGGTPAHRWLDVLADGVPIGIKVLADSQDEADEQLDHVTESLSQIGVIRDQLSIRAPDGWPQRMFGG